MIIPLESRATIQSPFSEEWDTLPQAHIKEFGIETGMTASDVFIAILRLHQNIKQFSYIVFDPENDSDIDSDPKRGSLDDEEVHWVPTTGLDIAGLEALSLSVIEETREKRYPWIRDGENDEKNMWFGIPAITSNVEMEDGSIVDIPMLDFCIEKSEEVVERIASYLQGTPGVLLETDRSYHFWGVTLLRKSEWYSFLKSHFPDYYHVLKKLYNPRNVSFGEDYGLEQQLRQLTERSGVIKIDRIRKLNLNELINFLSKDDQIVDATHLKTSLDRDYSALRFHGYSGTSKTMTPRVVRVIT